MNDIQGLVKIDVSPVFVERIAKDNIGTYHYILAKHRRKEIFVGISAMPGVNFWQAFLYAVLGGFIVVGSIRFRTKKDRDYVFEHQKDQLKKMFIEKVKEVIKNVD